MSVESEVTRAPFSDYRLVAPAIAAWGSSAIILTLVTSRVRPPLPAIVLVLIGMLICAIGIYPTSTYQPRHSTYPAGSIRAAAILALMIAALAGFSALTNALHYRHMPLVECRTQCRVEAVLTHRSRPLARGWLTRVQPTALHHGLLVLRTSRPIPAGESDTITAVGRIEPFGTPPTLGLMQPVNLTVVSQPSRTHTFRNQVRAALEPLPPDVRGLITGMSLGDSADMSYRSRSALRATSTTHVTAMSGMHLGIIMMTLHMLIPGRPRSKIALLALIVALLIAIVGPQPSIIRATSMAAVMAVGYSYGRPGQATSSLATVVIAWLIINPWLALSFGFGLSVAATAGVLSVVHSRGDNAAEERGRRWLRSALMIVAVPAGAAIATAPILVQLTGELPVFAIPANIAILPAVAPTTLAGLATALCATFFPALTPIPLAVAEAGARWILTVTGWFAGLPHATIGAPLATVVAWTGLLAAALVLIGRVLPLFVSHGIPHETLTGIERIE